MDDAERTPLAPFNIFFLLLAHTVGIGGAAVYLAAGRLSHVAWVLAVVWSALTIFSLSAGYHRLFSHRAYEAHPVLRFLLLALDSARNSCMAIFVHSLSDRSARPERLNRTEAEHAGTNRSIRRKNI